MPTIELKYPIQFEKQARLTYEHYDLVDIIGTGDERYVNKALKPKIQRVCLFCGGVFGALFLHGNQPFIQKNFKTLIN